MDVWIWCVGELFFPDCISSFLKSEWQWATSRDFEAARPAAFCPRLFYTVRQRQPLDVSESAHFPFGVFPHFGRLVGGGGGVSVLFIYEVKTIRPPRRKITVDLQLDDPSCKMVL